MSCKCSCCFGKGCTLESLPPFDPSEGVECEIELCRLKYPDRCLGATNVRAVSGTWINLIGALLAIGLVLAFVLFLISRSRKKTEPGKI